MFKDQFESLGLSYAFRRSAGWLLLWGGQGNGSACRCFSSRAPAGGRILQPAPNRHFRAPIGEVQVVGLIGHVACYTTDGTDPVQAKGACSGASTARLSEASRITLSCGKNETSATSVHGVKLAFDGDGLDGLTAAGDYVLDCTPAKSGRDGDGLPNGRDNCPVGGARVVALFEQNLSGGRDHRVDGDVCAGLKKHPPRGARGTRVGHGSAHHNASPGRAPNAKLMLHNAVERAASAVNEESTLARPTRADWTLQRNSSSRRTSLGTIEE